MKLFGKPIHLYLLICLLAGGAVFYYVLSRSTGLSLTHDEAYSFNVYAGKSFMGIVSYEHPVLPNNHILNTLGMKYSGMFFQDRAWSLRLPNLLFMLLYLGVCLKWLVRTQDKQLWVGGFLILIMNPYLLDFFGLARGYGMASALMAASIFAFWRLVSPGGRLRSAWWAFSLAALAVLASFTLLHFYLALSALWMFWILAGNLEHRRKGRVARRAFWRQFTPAIVVTVVLAIILYEPIRKMGGNTFGPKNGFWGDTVASLAFRSTYSQGWQWVDLIVWLTGVVLVLGAVLGLAEVSLQKYKLTKVPWLVPLLLFCLSAISTVAQHAILGTEYLHNRVGLFFIPLFLITLVSLIGAAFQWPSMKIWMTGLVFLLAGISVYNVSQTINYKYSLDWKYDAETKDMLDILVDYHQSDSAAPGDRINLGIDWLYSPSIKYYQQVMEEEYSNILPVHREGFRTDTFDYYYLWLLTDKSWIDSTNLQLIKAFPLSESALYKRIRE